DSDPLPEFLRKPRTPSTPAWCKRERLAVLVGLGSAAMLMIAAALVASGIGSRADASDARPALRIAVNDPAPVVVTAPAGKLEVPRHVENGFQGVPERPGFPSLGQVFDALIGYGPRPQVDDVAWVDEPPPQPEAAEAEPTVRRYASLTPAAMEAP